MTVRKAFELIEKIIESIKSFFSGIPDALSSLKSRHERRRADRLRRKAKKEAELPAELVKERVRVVRAGSSSDGPETGEKRGVGFDLMFFIRTLTRFGVAFAAFAAIGYFGYHTYRSFIPAVTTGEVRKISESFSCTGTAYLLRDAERIPMPVSGFADYSVRSGDRVAKGDLICRVYSSDRSDIRETIDALDAELALLKKSAGGGVSSEGILATSAGIADSYLKIMEKLSSGDIGAAGIMADELREKMSRELCLTGRSEGITEMIEKLTKQRSEAVAALGSAASSVKASAPGYFFIGADGYENIFTLGLADELTEETFAKAVSELPESFAPCLGTLSKSSEWKLAVSCPGFDMLAADIGKKYSVTLTDDDCLVLEMKLEKKIRTDDGMILLFDGGTMPQGCSWLRCQNVSIVYESYEGYRVPTSAVRLYEGMTGVYTVKSGHVTFRRIKVLTEGEGYFIVSDYESSGDRIPEVTRYLPYGMSGPADETASMRAFAVEHGLSIRNARNGGPDFLRGDGYLVGKNGMAVLTGRRLPTGTRPLPYGAANIYYQMLNGTDELILTGKNLYHGKVLN